MRAPLAPCLSQRWLPCGSGLRRFPPVKMTGGEPRPGECRLLRRGGWRSRSSARGTAEASLLACFSGAMLCVAVTIHPGSPPVLSHLPAPHLSGSWGGTGSPQGDLTRPSPCCSRGGSQRRAAVTARVMRVPHESGGYCTSGSFLHASGDDGANCRNAEVPGSPAGCGGKGRPSLSFSYLLPWPEVFLPPEEQKR